LEVGGRGKIISDCETGNPPEGWESEGQLRIVNLGARSQNSEFRSKKVCGMEQGAARRRGEDSGWIGG
jgi:hypothetical protein